MHFAFRKRLKFNDSDTDPCVTLCLKRHPIVFMLCQHMHLSLNMRRFTNLYSLKNRESGDMLFPSPDHWKIDKMPFLTLYFLLNIISEMEPKM